MQNIKSIIFPLFFTKAGVDSNCSGQWCWDKDSKMRAFSLVIDKVKRTFIQIRSSLHQKKKHTNSFLFLFLIAIMCLVTRKSIAQINSENWKYVSDEVKETCDSVKNISIPAQDLPGETIKKTLKKCDSVELYFGFKNPPDYVKARYCAMVNQHYDVLIMIYANGKGVESNLDLATHFACLFDGAGAEIDGRIKHLTKLKQQGNFQKNFNICDNITSGYMMAVCADYAQKSSVDKQKKHLEALTLTLKKNEQEQLKKLLAASSLYFNARIDNEMDRFGSGAQAFMILEQMNLNADMIKLIDKASKCKVQSQTTEQFQTADKELNKLYKKIQNIPNEDFSGISKKGIKITERSWLKYKSAWVDFGLSKCPEISKETWETLITKDRIKQLKTFF